MTLTVLTVVVGVDPAALVRRAPDWAGWVTGQQRLDRVMSRVAPPLFLSTAATAAGAALLALGQHRTTLAVTRAAAAGCTVAAIRVTLTVNEPANDLIRSWRPSDVPPDDWREVRARWDRGHRWRRGLIAVAAGSTAWGLLQTTRAAQGTFATRGAIIRSTT